MHHKTQGPEPPPNKQERWETLHFNRNKSSSRTRLMWKGPPGDVSGWRRALLSWFWIDQTCRCDYSPQSSFFATQLDDNRIISALMKQGKYIPHRNANNYSLFWRKCKFCSKSQSADAKLPPEQISFRFELAARLSECFPTVLIPMLKCKCLNVKTSCEILAWI